MDRTYSKKTTIELWTDPYISKKMLEAHLDPYNDAASRKKETIKKTCDFIEQILPISKSICDYGCGPGLYTNILEQKGYKVTGIDVSKNSIAYAKAQNRNVTYLKMNYIEEVLKNKVDFIMMIYCDFGAMSPYEQVHTLNNIKQSLKPNGLFFFDVMNDDYFNKTSEIEQTYEETDGFFMKGYAEIKRQVIKYPKDKLILTHYHINGNKEVDFYNYDKCYNALDMRTFLEENGYEIIDVYSDTTGKKEFNTDTLAFLARVKDETR